MKTTKITVKCGMTRGKDFQAVRYEIAEEIDLEEGDERETVIKTTRTRLMFEVHNYAEKALQNLLGKG